MEQAYLMANQQPLSANLLGNLSGFGANHHLRQSLVFIICQIVQKRETYIGNVSALFDESGKINDEGTVQLLQLFANAFVDLIKKYQA